MTMIPIRLGRPTTAGGARDSATSDPGEMPGPDPRRGSALVDTHGRVHRDLRISLTDRCSLRCTYCMPEQGNEWLSRSSILTTDEIVRLARIAAEAGISTFRLTGESLSCVVMSLTSLPGLLHCGPPPVIGCRLR